MFFLKVIFLITTFCIINSVYNATLDPFLLLKSDCESDHCKNNINNFKNWINKFNINIENDYKNIYNNWLDNDKYIKSINSKNLTYILAHNKFSGMNFNQFTNYMNFNNNINIIRKGNPLINNKKLRQLSEDIKIFNSIDWREKNIVSPIRNQGRCGSCWAFSGISTLESAIAIKTGELYDLSEQQCVDCSTTEYGYDNLGCNGGMYDVMWEYVFHNDGICLENNYPYKSGITTQTGICHTNCTILEESKVIGYVNVHQGSDISMMRALSTQPVSIAIQAGSRAFQLYQSGIFSDFEHCGSNLDHAVVLVGYDKIGDQDYYILRNSWGEEWGENGYMRIAKGKKYEPEGMCGLLLDPMFPLV